jgi:hypothetical protein
MKSACRVSIRQTSFNALTPCRGVPTAVLFDHHHSLVPLRFQRGDIWRRISLIRSGGRGGLVSVPLREQRPRGSGRPVGDGHGDEACRFALEKRSDPDPGSGIFGCRPSCDGGGADREQSAQVAVAHLRYMAETILAAG